MRPMHLFLVILAATIQVSCGGAKLPASKPHDLLGQTPEPATRPALDGPMIDIPASGKITIIDFWGTFCEPCLKEMPQLEKWWKGADHSRAQVIGISMDDDSYAVEQKLAELGITFPQVIDDGLVLKGRYLVDSVPAAFVIDETGKIRHFEAGDDYCATDLIRVAEALLSE